MDVNAETNNIHFSGIMNRSDADFDDLLPWRDIIDDKEVTCLCPHSEDSIPMDSSSLCSSYDFNVSVLQCSPMYQRSLHHLLRMRTFLKKKRDSGSQRRDQTPAFQMSGQRRVKDLPPVPLLPPWKQPSIMKKKTPVSQVIEKTVQLTISFVPAHQLDEIPRPQSQLLAQTGTNSQEEGTEVICHQTFVMECWFSHHQRLNEIFPESQWKMGYLFLNRNSCGYIYNICVLLYV